MDNENRVIIISGLAKLTHEINDLAAEIVDKLARVVVEWNWGPRDFDGDPMQWRRSELNSEADYLANYAMHTKGNFQYVNRRLIENRNAITNLPGRSDGGCRAVDGISSYGWRVKAWLGRDGQFIIAAGAMYFDRSSTSSISIEAAGALALWKFVMDLLKGASIESRTYNDMSYASGKRLRRVDGILQRCHVDAQCTVFR